MDEGQTREITNYRAVKSKKQNLTGDRASS